MTNRLYYGDNLEVLRNRDAFPNESVDLIYLDPPFNSNASYNILFKSPAGSGADASFEAFDDTWHWGPTAEAAYDDVMKSPFTDVAELLRTMRSFLRDNDMMAYLAMMAVRLIELHRVLKPTGSLYLHCDPTASHYLKLLLDGVFGVENYRNEIVWLRTNAHNMKSKSFPRSNDIIFFYSKSSKFKFNQPYAGFSAAQLKRYKPDADGRLYTGQDLTFSSSNKDRQFTFRGTTPPPGRSWGASLEQLESWWTQGLILTKLDGTPRLDGHKVYLDEKLGKPVDTNWIDIPRIGNTSAERLGYPTQKPISLLERIILASSDVGDVVLDPFCGCGTALHASQLLKRQWIGIDVTHLAIVLIEKRLRSNFKDAIDFTTEGRPKDLASAQELAKRDKFEFQKWITTEVGGVPWRGGRKGADGVGMIAELVETITRENAAVGILLMAALPTREMEARAAAAGFYDLDAHGRFARIQIITLAELFAGKRPHLPNISRALVGKSDKVADVRQDNLL
jgi:site-specific DNA-methyltransferase (adenine-specific)